MTLLHVEVHDGHGPPCLLVHGMLSSRAQWLANLDALASVCQPVVVELLGHGRSPSPGDGGCFTPDAYLEHLDQVWHALGGPKWFLVGQSLGAALTLRYALEHPERVIAQAFTNSSSALASEAWRARLSAATLPLADRIETLGQEAIAAMPTHPRRARRLPADVKAALVADAELFDPHGIACAFRHTVPASSVRHRFSQTAVPTLLVCGTRERAFASSRDYAVASLPGLRVVDLDAGHGVNAQAATGFNAAVCSFFAEHAGAESRSA